MSLAKQWGLPRMRGGGALLGALLADALGTGIYAPFSLLYFTVAIGLPLPAVGFALSVASALTLPLNPVAGALVDRFGARRVVIVAQLLQAIGFLGYLFVGSIPALFLAAVPVTAGLRMFWAAYGPLVATVAAAEERDRWFGLAGAAQNAGLGVAGLLAGVLIATGNPQMYRALVIANLLSFLISAGLLLRLRPQYSPSPAPQEAHREGYRAVLDDRPFLALVGSNIAFALCSLMITVALPLYFVEALHAPAWTVGTAFAFSTALLALAQTAVVRAAEPYRRTRLIALAGVVWIVSFGLFALAPAVSRVVLAPYLLLAVAIYTLGELLHGPTSNALAAAASPEHLRGRYMALFQLSWGIASAIAPTLFAVLFAVRPAFPWLAVAALTLIAVAVILRAEPRLPAAAVRAPQTDPPGLPRDEVTMQVLAYAPLSTSVPPYDSQAAGAPCDPLLPVGHIGGTAIPDREGTQTRA